MTESIKYNIRVRCRYKFIKVDKNFLPLFIRFKEQNHVEFVFDDTVSKENINKVIETSKQWFEDLTPLNISKESIEE